MQEYKCCIRARLGQVSDEARDIWWPARFDEAVVEEVRRLLETSGFPLLDRYASRDAMLAQWANEADRIEAISPPPIVMAIILTERGQGDRARELLSRQAREVRNPGHPAAVRGLAERLGLGTLDDLSWTG